HFNYPLEDNSGHITVATTRPETMLGDTGVAVHPDDDRYKDLIGKNVVLPIVGRLIPIVADEYADPEKGSGAVKITPAHDFNDFEVGKRCNLAAINMLDQHAAIDLSDEAFADMDGKDDWHGLDRYEARKKIVATLEAMGLVDKIEPDTHMVPYGDRSNQVIEPWLTDQWYVDAETMAKPAIAAVKNGDTKFVPPNWDKTYFEWMNNIQPWCISRPLWWGHQIPAWYDEDGKVYVAESEDAAQAQAGAGVALTRDEDVLDTWFSSALWPFSTLGWPDETPELKRHYKTDVLVTGFDIIFFWVARMMMSGLHFMDDEVPFHTVYVHALVRDEKGAKMSKSKGNVVDPLELMDKYGADALRFTLSAMAAMGRDIKLAESRVEGYRNFATKLWNAARFCEMNGCFEAGDFDPAKASLPLTQWLVGEVVRAQNAVTTALEAYRFNDASNAVYQFIWNSFCDWYVELAKPALQSDGQGEDETEKAEVQAATKWAMENALRLLHPFMPFVTEDVWAKTGARDNHLMLDTWPTRSDALINKDADAEINWLIEAIGEIRSVRSEMNVPAGAQVPLIIVGANDATKARLGETDAVLKRLARLAEITEADAVPDGAVQTVLGEATLAITLADVIDVDAEKARLKKDIGKVEGEIKKISGKLGNQGFLDKAPQAVIDENKTRLAEEEARRDKLQSALERIS
ncbi:MAG: valine--tRNA ligase, partial [Alphaproteobacteria bacterium]|nr:valine--tRNA ligase [Alphaproteobacteria bacterium]